MKKWCLDFYFLVQSTPFVLSFMKKSKWRKLVKIKMEEKANEIYKNEFENKLKC